MTMTHWILEDMKPKQVDSVTWARWFKETRNRFIHETTVGDIRISTVFLGLNYRFGDGPPLLFETMIFGGPLDQSQWRYSTLGEAKKGHWDAVESVKGDNS